MRVWLLTVALLVLLPFSSAGTMDIQYTEDIAKFKSDNQRGRMEVLMACWLHSRDHTNNPHLPYRLALIKACMQRISRKDSVSKITSLIGKNMSQPKEYSQIVPAEHMPDPGHFDMEQLGEFDSFIWKYIEGYEKDLAGIQSGPEGEDLRKQVETALEKRQHYYFGIIPANKFTHTILLITIALLLVLCCTCWKYFQKKGQKKEKQVNQKEQFFKKSNFTKGKKRV